MGLEDLHESRFDHLGLSAKISALDDEHTVDGVRYTGVSFEDSEMSYTIIVYPSSDMEEEYLTKWPLLIGFIMVGMFLLTVG